MAGVAELLSKEGAGDRVLQLSQFDPFGFHRFYGKTDIYPDPNQLIQYAQKIQSNFDKIVIHDFSEFKTYFPNNKVVLFFHGTKLRQMPDIEKEQCKQYKCFVSTNDLLQDMPSATYIPQPIDYDHFSNKGVGKGWIAINRSYQRDYIEKKIKEKYPNTLYYERNSKNLIDYSKMPDFLRQYSDYVDWKFTYDKPIPRSLPNLSCTGLQALSLGLTVHNSNGTVIDDPLLRILHNSKNVAERFLNEIEN